MLKGFLYLGLLTLIPALLVIYLEKKNPEKTPSWLSFLAINPLLGFLLYLILGCTPLKRRIFSFKHIPGDRLPNLSNHQLKIFTEEEVYIQDSLQSKNLVRLLLKNGYAPLTRNHAIKLFNSGQEKFAALIQDLEDAQHHIHIEYYIFQDDKIGKTIQDVLVRKSQAGVKIRIIVDGLGSRSLSKEFLARFRNSGIGVKWFFPLCLPQMLFTLNYRNHRKLVVIDGRVGYLGGINVGDEYLSRNPKYGFWRDTHLRIEGESVQTIQETFRNDWYFVTQENLKDPLYFPKPLKCGKILAQVIAGGPDSKDESVKELFFTILNIAEKEIFLTTPYFIPDESMTMALKSAARRGIQVKILVQGKPDHKLTYLASGSYFADLMKAGVEIFRYQKGILHSKVLTIDEKISIVGSANFDIRSFQIDFELSTIVYNEEFAKELKQSQAKDLVDSIRITEEEIKGQTGILGFETVLARLFSPLL